MYEQTPFATSKRRLHRVGSWSTGSDHNLGSFFISATTSKPFCFGKLMSGKTTSGTQASLYFHLTPQLHVDEEPALHDWRCDLSK
jgi:hypothetical protein